MDRRFAVLGLVVLVGLSGCSAPIGDPSPTETSPTSATPTAGDGDRLPGVEADGSLSDPEALIVAHSRALAETGYETSTTVRVKSQAPGGETDVTEYTAVVDRGSAPFRVEINTSVGDRLTSRQIIWGNESVRYRRLGLPSSGGNASVEYDRRSGGPPSIDPGIRAYEDILAAGDFRVVGESEEGIRLVADGLNPDAFALNPIQAHSYSGELVADDRGRIRRAEIRMEYTDARGQAAVMTIEYSIDREGGVNPPTPTWIGTASRQTRDIAIAVRAVDDDRIVITNTGSEPIPADARFVVVSRGRSAVLDLEAEVAPGETVYVFDPVGAGIQLGREVPDDVTEIRGAFRIILRGSNDEEIAAVDIEFD